MDLSLVHGEAHFLFVFELCAASLLALFLAVARIASHPRGVGSLWSDLTVFSKVFFCLVLFLYFYSQWLSGGRPLAAVGLAMPGSLVTRSFAMDMPFWLRRCGEPALWLLFLCTQVAHADSHLRSAGRLYRAAGLSLLLLVGAETLIASELWSVRWALQQHRGLVELVHFLLGQCVVIVLIAALSAELLGGRKERTPRKVAGSVAVGTGLFAGAVALVAIAYVRQGPLQALLVGAHYYSWFPENWRGGVIGQKLTPPILPALGEYHSDSAAVFDQHVRWAKDAGLDFFVFDWWPRRPEIGARVYSHVVRRNALAGMQFAVLYESLDVKEPGDRTFVGEEANVAYLTEERIERMKKHWEYLARHYFKRENYLKIDGKPVLFIYASRHLVGPVAAAMAEARKHVFEKSGLSLYLIGDEIFFNTLTFSRDHGLLLLAEELPNWDRLSAFDAITTYNPYDASRDLHGGSAGAEQFLTDVSRLYAAYRAYASSVGLHFIPGVLPGYNDRAIRPDEDHFVVPRDFGDPKKSFFSESLRRWGAPFLDRKRPMLTVTSWNEWNEGTQIEPSMEPSSDAPDPREEGEFFTQGEPHHPYGTSYLKQLRASRIALGR
ncbi:MAG: glycoside hydrolase family 99-like domain-containing protein [Bdellovibrionales bacterium]|nr:glycoside hydrolase family 99-like domain-containing protein [Bdellovibrionales bacterium]